MTPGTPLSTLTPEQIAALPAGTVVRWVYNGEAWRARRSGVDAWEIIGRPDRGIWSDAEVAEDFCITRIESVPEGFVAPPPDLLTAAERVLDHARHAAACVADGRCSCGMDDLRLAVVRARGGGA